MILLSPKAVFTRYLNGKHLHLDSKYNVVIGNVFGEMKYFYSKSAIVFVGGSLVDLGGQNVLEPISMHRLTMIGKYYDNFNHYT